LTIGGAAAQSTVVPGPVRGEYSAPTLPSPPLDRGQTSPPLLDRAYTPPEGLRGISAADKFSAFPLRVTNPIFMTSINYPGVYGAYYYGAAPSVWVPFGASVPSYTLRPAYTSPPPMNPSAAVWTTPAAPKGPTAEALGSPATITIHVPEGGMVWV